MQPVSKSTQVYSRGETRKGARVTCTRHRNKTDENLVVSVDAQSNYYPNYPGHREENA